MVRRPGRPNGGIAHLERREGDPIAKQRAVALVKTMFGDLMVKDACAELAISRTRFQQLREQVLGALLGAMHFGRPGRPSKVERRATAAEISALRAEIARLQHELALAHAQAELATGLRALEARKSAKLAARARPGRRVRPQRRVRPARRR